MVLMSTPLYIKGQVVDKELFPDRVVGVPEAYVMVGGEKILAKDLHKNY